MIAQLLFATVTGLSSLAVPDWTLANEVTSIGDPYIYFLGSVTNPGPGLQYHTGYYSDSRCRKVDGSSQQSPPSWATDLASLYDLGDLTVEQNFTSPLLIPVGKKCVVEANWYRDYHMQSWVNGNANATRTKELHSSGSITRRITSIDEPN